MKTTQKTLKKHNISPKNYNQSFFSDFFFFKLDKIPNTGGFPDDGEHASNRKNTHRALLTSELDTQCWSNFVPWSVTSPVRAPRVCLRQRRIQAVTEKHDEQMLI